jgi:hypothetical protein
MCSVTERRADWYRVKAAQCDHKAKEAVDQGVKAYFAEMVRDSTYLAELAERQGLVVVASAKLLRPSLMKKSKSSRTD